MMFRLCNAARNVFSSPQRLAITKSSISRWETPFIASKSRLSTVKCVTWMKTNPEAQATLLGCGQEKRQFQTSSVKNAPPLLLLLVKPLAKYAAIFFGKTAKIWWKKLPPEKREKVLSKIKGSKRKFYIIGILFIGGFIVYYVMHLHVDPITGRRRFIILSNEQIRVLAQSEVDTQIEKHKGNFLLPSHPSFKKIVNVSNKLLNSNNDILQVQNRKWLVTVIDEPDVRNAFVLPTGHIFIFTGLLKLCTNDDQLAVLISHEISHVILNHGAEQVSNLFLLNNILTIPLLVVYAVVPEAAAKVNETLARYFTKIMFHLPYSRHLEKEADEIGLVLTAKACYDIRESTVLWTKMTDDDVPPEFLSTHPSSEHRLDVLDSMIPQAMKFREERKCPKLPTKDPRTSIPDYHPQSN